MKQRCLQYVLGARVLVSERESKLESELEQIDHSCSLSSKGTWLVESRKHCEML